jgi:hypothetical protein
MCWVDFGSPERVIVCAITYTIVARMRDFVEAVGFIIAVGAVFYAYLRGHKIGYDKATRLSPPNDKIEKLENELAGFRKTALERWLEEQKKTPR